MIKKLDELTVKQIAAGEIIEGPVSVIKELIENSIDAGSKNIDILVMRAGKEMIRVVDNGEGIPPDEINIAMERHATSKIVKSSDLQVLETLGFRGEALPSISAVSQLLLETKTAGEEIGISVSYSGGQLVEKKEVGLPQGTMVAVKDLFFNVPARKKFMRQDSSEMRKIVMMVQNFCLSHPHISFSLTSKNRLLLKTKGNSSLEEVIKTVCGEYFFEELLEISCQQGDFTLAGYLGNPGFAKPHRKDQYFFVNKRIVQSDLIRRALEAGYNNLLLRKQFPVAILNISLPPQQIDVNIHPGKMEVRFRNEKEIYKIIQESVQAKLKTPRIIPVLNKNYKKQTNLTLYTDQLKTRAPYEAELFNAEVQEVNKTYAYEGSDVNVEDNDIEKQKDLYGGEDTSGVADIEEKTNYSLPPISIRGQFLFSYITGLMADNFIFIDQHAAHERIIYENLCKKAEQPKLPLQQSVLPQVLKIPSLLLANIFNNISLLEAMGFKIEQFGDNTFVIRALPYFLENIWSKSLIFNILVDTAEDNFTSIEQLQKKIITLTACKNAIKAGQKMHREEMIKLVADLRKTNNPYSCPHGRPTILKITKKNLDYFFKRSGGKT